MSERSRTRAHGHGPRERGLIQCMTRRHAEPKAPLGAQRETGFSHWGVFPSPGRSHMIGMACATTLLTGCSCASLLLPLGAATLPAATSGLALGSRTLASGLFLGGFLLAAIPVLA